MQAGISAVRESRHATGRRRQDVVDENAGDARRKAGELAAERQSAERTAAADRHEDPVRRRQRTGVDLLLQLERGIDEAEHAGDRGASGGDEIGAPAAQELHRMDAQHR